MIEFPTMKTKNVKRMMSENKEQLKTNCTNLHAFTSEPILVYTAKTN